MKNKYVAAFLAIVFGWLGFHKFYLGKWFQGLLYIIFGATFIPLILSIFEGILYLINNQEWFDIKFNVEYMQKKDYLSKRK